MLHNGDVVIQIDAENHQIIFAISEDKKATPIVFDLEQGLILNANFPEPPPPPIPPT
jgi:hypothetical protein